MTPQIALLLAFIAAALVLFWFESIPADVIALGVLVGIILTGLLPPEDAFAGFGSDTVVMILGLLILTAGLMRTGVVDLAARAILRRAGTDPHRLLIVVMVAAAGVGAFISNTASTAFFLPVTIGIALRAGINASKLLMPLAFASILTSSVTLISTSTNIVVSGLMTRYRMAPMGMFELAPVGIPIAVVGLLYMLTLGRRLIPERVSTGTLEDGLGARPYLSEIIITPNSKLAGKTLEESRLGHDLDLTVLRIIRDGAYMLPRANTRLRAGDVLLAQGRREDLLKVKDIAGIEFKAEVELPHSGLSGGDLTLAEVIIMARSPLIGRTLKAVGFRERFDLQVLAINRHAQTLRRKLSDVRLRMGDVLVVQGMPASIAAMEGRNVRVLGRVEDKPPVVRRAPIATAIFIGVIAAATLHLLPLPVAVLLGVLLAFLTRCLTPEEAYREVEWKAIILIGAMLAVGRAMDQTGAARFLAAQLVYLWGNGSGMALLSAFFVLTVLLTQPMSNQAAAIVVLPVAVQAALQLGVNPRAFAMMVAVAASCSYLTPLEPSCLMVYGPGRYRFGDFMRVGALLTLAIYVVAIVLVPRVWPLGGR